MKMDSNEKKVHIMNAAKKCFIDNGFKETGMRDIAGEAGVALGTLYSYFKNKQELFDALNMPELEDYRPEFERKKDHVFSKALNLFAKKGYDNVTMEAIADACSLTRANLYQYFSNKEDLFKQMILQNHAVSYTDGLASRNTSLPMENILADVSKKYFEITKKKNQLLLFKEVTKNSEKFPELIDIYYEYNMQGPCNNLTHYIVRSCSDRGITVTDVEKLRSCVSIFLSSLQNYLLTKYVICGIEHRQDEKSFINAAVSVFMGYLKSDGYV